MARGSAGAFEGWDDGEIKTQSLVVICGPFEGRICENDDEMFAAKSELNEWEYEWFTQNNVVWRTLEAEEGEEFDPNFDIGVDCEIVTFGFYLECRGTYLIPRQFLRPATTRDLILRDRKISEEVFSSAWRSETDLDESEVIGLLKEQNYILNEVWAREKTVTTAKGSKNVFLCHSSADKPYVRQVCLDLGRAGHKPWLDEFEIGVGDSIVEKIEKGATEAGALILFLSEAAAESSWVKREWSSVLARQLSKKDIGVLPAVIEDCSLPAILADIKYADFRHSYNSGLGEILAALSTLKVKKTKAKHKV